MAARLPEMGFLLAGGEPNDIERLHHSVKTMGLQNVSVHGFIPNAALPRYHAACDAFLMPYQRRVAASSGGDIARYLSPMKLFEYMACGRPILSSDLPVFGEVLSPENAILLPPDNVDAWVNTLLSLRLDPQRCASLGEQARRDASRYTWEARARKILEKFP
jgi:glycosyltransferase involved in cell wall biosynthesis